MGLFTIILCCYGLIKNMALDFILELQVTYCLVPEYFLKKLFFFFRTGTVHKASVVLTFYYFRMLTWYTFHFLLVNNTIGLLFIKGRVFPTPKTRFLYLPGYCAIWRFFFFLEGEIWNIYINIGKKDAALLCLSPWKLSCIF